MTGFGALLRKEFLEMVRTRRLLVALVLFVLVGLGSPLVAKGIPFLLSRIPKDQMGGVEMLLTQDPTVKDALVQYLKNFTMLPFLVVLLSMGTVAGERRREILPVVLSKPVSRRSYLLAKLVAPTVLHAGGTVLAAAGAYLYTRVLFGEVWIPGFIALNGALFLLLWLFLAATLLASVVARGAGAVAASGFGFYVFLMALSSFPSFGRFTPAGLLILAGDLVAGRAPVHVGWSVGTAVLLGVLLVGLADRILARQEI